MTVLADYPTFGAVTVTALQQAVSKTLFRLRASEKQVTDLEYISGCTLPADVEIPLISFSSPSMRGISSESHHCTHCQGNCLAILSENFTLIVRDGFPMLNLFGGSRKYRLPHRSKETDFKIDARECFACQDCC